MTKGRRWSGFTILLMAALMAGVSAHPIFGDSDQSAKEDAFVEHFNRAVGSEFVDGDASGGGSGDSDTQTGNSGGLVSTALAKLQVHGFLTQAWAGGNFVDIPAGLPAATPTVDELSIGIPEDGTTNYRQLALQFRYEMSPKDLMIIQLSSRALGFSPIGKIEDEIDLDWAFYERKLTDHTSVKVGRVQLPFGIYNEIRDVGTVLPFYRPAFGIYRTGAFTSETVDGLVLIHHFAPESDWRFETNWYWGEFDEIELADENTVTFTQDVDCYGLQWWLNTPVPDLRLGLSLGTRKIQNSIFLPGVEKSEPFEHWMFSVDYTVSRFTFRGEYQNTQTEGTFEGVGTLDFDLDFYYVEAGVRVTDKFQIWAQYDKQEQDISAAIFTEPDKRDVRTDFGVSLNYFFAPNVVLKAEYHEYEEGFTGYAPVFLPPPVFFQLQPLFFTLDGGDYTIISLSVSF